MIKSYWNEEWKEIPFDEGALKKRYAISNYGRIISFIDNIDEGDQIKGGTLRGYPTLPLRPYGKSKTYYIHKLVAELFIPNNSDDKQSVIHKDYNKSNNYVENLQWATKSEMFAHQQGNPLVLEAREKQKGRKTQQGHKLSATQVMLLKKKILDPNRKTRLKLIAKQFGISEMQLYRIKSGENWSHIEVDVEEGCRDKD
ncbi:NUMOD4 domain-containing protein [Carboxylicivirga linearis]|uniref:NUMOD4 motif-containing HNH endonuclease n=1 Tax=Carboxylicivirga linearis TaxID=1628157 RepID=A0ABS5JRC7_9BACT|nr:NUMOD4 domain-containing protein [Carboxylicivirga linearis]MBS2096956.1 NUMOD4 motif-containing HNH endonuclease [Carboxylicivirga linearis]